MDMHCVCLSCRICKHPLFSCSQHRPGINTVGIESQSIDRPVAACLVKAPVSRHSWLTDVRKGAERSRNSFSAHIDDHESLLADYWHQDLGAGVGRDLGIGVERGVGVGLGLEVAVAVGVGVADTVAVAVGVGVGVPPWHNPVMVRV